jgi:tetratricopeptide (TPR) repeat protein
MEVISCIDGRSAFSEVIEKAVEKLPEELDAFVALSVIRSLVANGDVASLNPVELFQLGMEFQEAGNHAKAFKLYSRAAELGLDDFDIAFKIAQALEALGRPAEAAAKYREFGDKCLTHTRIEEAIKSYRKAAELEPGALDLQRKLVDILLRENRREEALSTALKLALRRQAAGDSRGALELLLELRRTRDQG